MQQLLNPTKRAEPPAYETAEQDAREHKEAQDVHGYVIACAPLCRLHGADGAGPQCSGTGIAVEAGDAHVFQPAFVDFSLKEALHMRIGGKCEQGLDPFPLIQSRCTPGRY